MFSETERNVQALQVGVCEQLTNPKAGLWARCRSPLAWIERKDLPPTGLSDFETHCRCCFGQL